MNFMFLKAKLLRRKKRVEEEVVEVAQQLLKLKFRKKIKRLKFQMLKLKQKKQRRSLRKKLQKLKKKKLPLKRRRKSLMTKKRIKRNCIQNDNNDLNSKRIKLCVLSFFLVYNQQMNKAIIFD